MRRKKHAISPTRQENYPEWYQQVINEAELAEMAVVRGCMVIKPWGYAIWEQIQQTLNGMIKETGHQNIYCPLLLPLSFLEREAAHVKGFAKECAVVTHHRLSTNAKGKLEPVAPLAEPLVIRPTSEAIIGELFAKWVHSYRDLPLLVNQWANVVRWEMRPRLFLRTTEFLWQEGHTVHATAEDAMHETKKMLDVYSKLAENTLAIPVINGEKTATERFPGAENTYCIEAMMQDCKALQVGTSHFLGQNFSKAFDITFLNKDGNEINGWMTSWGVSTRLIGGIIMTHSDDDGLVLPPKLSPLHVVILPLIHHEADKARILEYCEGIYKALVAQHYQGEYIRVKLDDSDSRFGEKAWGWVKKGVPIRLEVGLQELETLSVFMGRRDYSYQKKKTISKEIFIHSVVTFLSEIQQNLFLRAKQFQAKNTKFIKSKSDFYDYFQSDRNGTSGFAMSPWIGDLESKNVINQDLKVTARCIPQDQVTERGKCLFTGRKAPIVLFAKAY